MRDTEDVITCSPNKQQADIKRLESDISEVREDFRLFVAGYLDRQKQQDEAHANAMKAIADTNKNVSELTMSVKGLVELWVVANGLQRFIKWLSSFAILAGLFTWVAAHFPSIKL